MYKNIAIVTRKTTAQRLGNKLELLKLEKLQPNYVKKLGDSERAHKVAIEAIKEILALHGLNLKVYPEGTVDADLEKADMVISIGGDGTFMSASHFLKKTPILGINSSPGSSIGRYCYLKFEPNSSVFLESLEAILNGQYPPRALDRLELVVENELLPLKIINDVLISESNPATLSRYHIKFGSFSEFQRSSGIWVTTASGSSAAYQSSGGKPFSSPNEAGNREFAFSVREPCAADRLKVLSGKLSSGGKLSIISAMSKGSLFMDGDYQRRDLPIGSELEISLSKEPLLAFL